jgi:hypothetical protein
MAMTTPRVSRPATPADVVALQYANPTRMVLIPVGILVAVVLVMTGITVAVVRAGGSGDDLDANGSVIWSLVGFLVAVGVQAVSVAFPLALALGSTRRTFTLGLLATSALQAVLLTVASLALLGLELATGGWFVGARVLSDSTLGGGSPVALVPVMFLSALTALVVGGIFGASWVRFGARGPAGLGLGIAVVAVGSLLLVAPDLEALGASFDAWWLAAAAAVVVALSTTGEYLLLRRASVR